MHLILFAHSSLIALSIVDSYTELDPLVHLYYAARFQPYVALDSMEQFGSTDVAPEGTFQP